tara:strand:- start:1409 stop:2050 length:642 start_codon:yes stop_codon:yes gene_type:complete
METTKAKMNWDHTRRTFLERLRRTRTDEAGWYDFFDTYSRLIYSVARKSGLGHSDAEDMVQSTTLKVAQYIQRFEINPGRGKFRNWVCMITKQQIANHYRKLHRQPPLAEWEPGEEEVASEIEDPVNQWDDLWENEYVHHVNDLALAEVKKKVSPKQYQIFHLYCIKEQDVERIATLLGVSPNEVYLAKNRVQPLYVEASRRILEDAREAVPA